jgi:hypothetical protein
VILVGEILPILLVAAIVLLAWRYSVSDQPKGQPQTESTDTDVTQLVAEGRMIDAIELYCTLHRTDLKTAKEAVEIRCGLTRSEIASQRGTLSDEPFSLRVAAKHLDSHCLGGLEDSRRCRRTVGRNEDALTVNTEENAKGSAKMHYPADGYQVVGVCHKPKRSNDDLPPLCVDWQ